MSARRGAPGAVSTAVHRLAAHTFRRLGGWVQWRVLWLVNDTFMVGVSALVHDDTGRVLVLRHRYWSAATWGLPSGYMHRRETPAQTIAREVTEETGLELVDLREVRHDWGYTFRVEVYVEARVVGNVDADALHIDGREVLAARFVRPDDLPDGILGSHRRMIEDWAASRFDTGSD